MLGLQRAGAKRLRIGLQAIAAVERGKIAKLQQVARGKPGVGVFGCFPGHRDAALDQDGEQLIGKVGGCDCRGALADKQPEADLFAFGAADILELAETHLNARRALVDVERVGRGRSDGNAALDHGFGDSAGVVGGLHRARP